MISIRSQSALYGTAKARELKVWSECDDVQDYVTIYDGYTTRDPVILKFCGGGEPVPEAISSGHELLVEFSTSPYGTFLHPTPIQSLHGFQLEVEVGDLLFIFFTIATYTLDIIIWIIFIIWFSSLIWWLLN